MELHVRLTIDEHERLLADLDVLGLPTAEAGIVMALELLHRRAKAEAAQATLGEDVGAWYAAHPEARATSALSALYETE